MKIEELKDLLIKRLLDSEILLEHSSSLIEIRQNNRLLKITYPYPVQEIYFDFLIDDALIHNDWIDFYMNETEEYILNYIVNIAYKFMYLEIKFVKDLQVYDNGVWDNIFQ